MKNLNFEIDSKGYKEYSINGDDSAVIRINSSDFNLPIRLEEMEKNTREILIKCEKYIEKRKDKITNQELLRKLREADVEIRKEIDEAFDSDVSSVLFGKSNCLSLCGGKPLFLNFLEVIVPAITEDINEEVTKSNKVVSTYTKQAKQFK